MLLVLKVTGINKTTISFLIYFILRFDHLIYEIKCYLIKKNKIADNIIKKTMGKSSIWTSSIVILLSLDVSIPGIWDRPKKLTT